MNIERINELRVFLARLPHRIAAQHSNGGYDKMDMADLLALLTAEEARLTAQRPIEEGGSEIEELIKFLESYQHSPQFWPADAETFSRIFGLLRSRLTGPPSPSAVTDEERRDLAQFVRELDADMFVACPIGPNESAQIKVERIRVRRNFDRLQDIIAGLSVVKETLTTAPSAEYMAAVDGLTLLLNRIKLTSGPVVMANVAAVESARAKLPAPAAPKPAAKAKTYRERDLPKISSFSASGFGGDDEY
jgi:hypothetical protein